MGPIVPEPLGPGVAGASPRDLSWANDAHRAERAEGLW